ncbi:MAG: methyltransferase domain-containing protein [Bacteroidetes bacterium]|nr:methyltransferase domain-containing protein [Bacteroidota bacterium]
MPTNAGPQGLGADYWSQRYQNGQTGWDLGRVSEPLRLYIDQLVNKDLKVLIPGCGNAYEAEYMLEQGFTNITLIDISDVLVKQLGDRLLPRFAGKIALEHGDFFAHRGHYDLIIEQTFFCALLPGFRRDYAVKMAQLLAPGGKLVGLLFDRHFEQSGPPFGGDRHEYLEYFGDLFELRYFSECYNSIPPRAGTELFISLVRK